MGSGNSIYKIYKIIEEMNIELYTCCHCGTKEESENEYYYHCVLCERLICNNDDCIVFPEDLQEDALCYDCAVSESELNELLK